MTQFARILMFTGVIIFLAGGLIYLLSRAGFPVGRLPGDIRIQGQNMTCIIPLATTILLSIVLTLVLNIVIRLLNK